MLCHNTVQIRHDNMAAVTVTPRQTTLSTVQTLLHREGARAQHTPALQTQRRSWCCLAQGPQARHQHCRWQPSQPPLYSPQKYCLQTKTATALHELYLTLTAKQTRNHNPICIEPQKPLARSVTELLPCRPFQCNYGTSDTVRSLQDVDAGAVGVPGVRMARTLAVTSLFSYLAASAVMGMFLFCSHPVASASKRRPTPCTTRQAMRGQ